MKSFKKLFVVACVMLIALIPVQGIFPAQAPVSTVSYTARKLLGDGAIYTFSWVSTTATSIGVVKGTAGTGFLVTNMNDRGISLELTSSESTEANVKWKIKLMGNHEASDDTSDYVTLDSTVSANSNLIRFTVNADTLQNYPYILYHIQGQTSNATAQSMSAKVFFDYDDKYVGGN